MHYARMAEASVCERRRRYGVILVWFDLVVHLERRVMLPNFLIIGAMKAGTTSLYRYLRGHPDVFMPDQKEIRYFVPERARRSSTPEGQRTQEVGWYEALFDTADGAIALGEASVDYTAYPKFTGVPERIARLLPDVRLVYLVRDPIERIRSQYLYWSAHATEWDPMEKAVFQSKYLDRSRYAMQIEQYMRWFSKDQLLVVTSECLETQRMDTLSRVYAFLGVDPDWDHPSLHERYHETSQMVTPHRGLRRAIRTPVYRSLGQYIPRGVKNAALTRFSRPTVRDLAPVSSDLRGRLADELRPDVAALYEYMDPQFDGWGIA